MRRWFLARPAFAGSAFALVSLATIVHAQGPLSPTVPPSPATTSTNTTPTIAPPKTISTPPTPSIGPANNQPKSVTSALPAASIAPPSASGTVPIHGATPTAKNPTVASVTTSKSEPPKPHVAYTLAQCISMTVARAAQIKMAKDRLAQAHAQLDEVKWIPWSQWTLSGGVAMVPEIRGSAVYSPNGDISISSRLGPAGRIGIEGVVPLWTFGKITSSTAAATAAVEVALQDIEKTRMLVTHDVRRAFFGLQLAHDARYLLEMAAQKLDDAVKKAEDNEDSDESDVLRMKTYQMEVKARLGEVEKYERISTAGLRFLTGIESPAPFDIPEEPITPPKKPLVDVLVYLKSAHLHRPELKQAQAGVEARKAQLDFAKARLYPDIGLGLSFGYSTAPIIADQTNPFVVDNANYLRYGVGIVFRWNLDILPAAARVRYAEAQLSEMRDLESYALGGVGVEVETAYATAKDASVREKFYGEAHQIAKRWVASVSAAIGIGTKEDKDIIDPLRSYLTNKYNHLQAIMDLDVAVSQLSVATGDDSIAEY